MRQAQRGEHMTAIKLWFGAPPAKLFCADEASKARAKSALSDAAKAEGAKRLCHSIEGMDELGEFIINVMSLSPYLYSTALRFAGGLEMLFDDGIEARIAALIEEPRTLNLVEEQLSEAQFMAALRKIKTEAHMLIALGDLAQIFDVEKTTLFLSQLAQECLSAAINWLLLDIHRTGKITLLNPDDPSRLSGLVVLGMGKMGGYELNYSSDIDIVIYFEPEAEGLHYAQGQDPTEVLSRMVRRLVRIMQERTGDGYVFRTDLRLRPDPGATSLAINVDSALGYYESRGQNWERAAFIKARPVAGDFEAGTRFLRDLKPFIWRKYLDFAAISDVQSIKRQIHAHKGHGKIAIHGHNLKLGRGGIREIEFFVQTQQLIAGGRNINLRDRSTVEMLSRLVDEQWIAPEVRDELVPAYHFLRRCEHAVQMISDEQSHTLPDNDGDIQIIAGLLGFETLDAFTDKLLKTLRCVEMHFGELFEDGDALSGQFGSLVFTGDEADPDTLSSLTQMGFTRPRDIWEIVRTWHFGRYRALRSEKAREQLTAMVPSLLESFAQAGQADETLLRFDKLMQGLPAGVPILSMINSNRHLLKLLTTILSSAPRLADIITKRPLIFDGMLEPAFFETLPTQQEQQDRLTEFLGEARFYEDSLDRLRIFAAEQRFLIGVRFLTGSIGAQSSGKALAGLADILLSEALDLALHEVESSHGKIAGARMCLVAMGRLGSQEMNSGSDVDLLLIYDADLNSQSDGARSIAASQYYTRVTQRLIAALTAPTAEGVLYEVDFRLRPSGNHGPLATSFSAFSKYQRSEAWTWEHMALTRARSICGDASLMSEMEEERTAIMGIERDVEKTAQDILDMRLRLAKDKPAKSIWDLKMVRGGLIDIEFLAQFWMLTALPNCKGELLNSNLKARSAQAILAVSNETFVDSKDKQILLDALERFTLVNHLISLCSAEKFDPAKAPKGLLELLCAATNMPSIEQLEASLMESQNLVEQVFNRILSLEDR